MLDKGYGLVFAHPRCSEYAGGYWQQEGGRLSKRLITCTSCGNRPTMVAYGPMTKDEWHEALDKMNERLSDKYERLRSS